MKKKFYVTIFTVLVFVQLKAQIGVLDSSFNNDGIVSGIFPGGVSYGNAIAKQTDGKILVTGYVEIGPGYDMYVARFDLSGNPDNSFGTGGNVITSITLSTDYSNAIAVQPDGKIVIAGDYDAGVSSDIALIRYKPDGTIDSTFGTNGIATTDFGTNSGDACHAMVLQPDGKLVVAGWTFLSDKDIALLRYNSDGTLDSTFGNNGKVITDINGEIQEANAIALQQDGKIVVTGFSNTSSTFNDVVVLRYNTDGVIDSTFNGIGYIIPNINNEDDEGQGIAVQPDGKIVIAGYMYSNFTYYDNVVMRFDATGMLDTSFNATGIVYSDINGFDNQANSLVLQPDGKIVTAGKAYITSIDISLSRFLSNGALDSTFGDNGHIITDVANDNDEAFAVLLQNDGRLVVSGYSSSSFTDGLIVCRYLNDSPNTTGINEIENTSFVVFPNPAGDILKIKIPGGTKSVPVTLQIYSADSKITTIRNIEPINGHEVIEVNLESLRLPPGIYFLQLINTEKEIIVNRKFVR